MEQPGWKRAAVAEGRAAGLGAAELALLDAFGGPGEVEARTLQPGGQRISRLPDVPPALFGEVDDHQAHMFGRRVAAVDAALGEGPADQLLRALLRGRLTEILAGPRPRALRVRALADFVYSQHARIAQGGQGPPPEALAESVRWNRVERGVEAATLAGQTALGPQRLHLLRLDPAAVRLRCIDCRGSDEDLAAISLRHGAVAALSGGFFLYSEPDITPPSQRTDPVGLLVSAGQVLSPPLFARTALVQAGDWQIRQVGLDQVQVGMAGSRLRALTATTRAQAEQAPGAPGGSVAIVGQQVVATAGPGEKLAVPLNGVVFGLRRPVASGPVTWALPGVTAAMAGGPLLVSGGEALTELAAAPVPAPQLVAEDFTGTAPPRTFSQDETGDRNLLPRMAVGLDRDGRLLAMAVDGRDLRGALGLTLTATGRVMAALGCVAAMNLDGGSSKRMVVQGRVVDHPSTEIHSADAAAGPAPRRPVHTAILVLPTRGLSVSVSGT